MDQRGRTCADGQRGEVDVNKGQNSGKLTLLWYELTETLVTDSGGRWAMMAILAL